MASVANDSDDLVQETAISALTRTDDAPPSKPSLATVMRNHFRMGHRSAMRRQARESRVQADRVDTLAPDDAAHRLQLLRALVERLEVVEIMLPLEAGIDPCNGVSVSTVTENRRNLNRWTTSVDLKSTINDSE